MGERDVEAILRTLEVRRRPGTYAYALLPEGASRPAGSDVVVREAEGFTVVLLEADAAAQGLATTFPCAWLTIDVHTALEGVGLTSVLARTLAEQGIACNVVAAYHHHLLVPIQRADEAMAALRALRPA